jgi:hypothetical protein
MILTWEVRVHYEGFRVAVMAVIVSLVQVLALRCSAVIYESASALRVYRQGAVMVRTFAVVVPRETCSMKTY